MTEVCDICGKRASNDDIEFLTITICPSCRKKRFRNMKLNFNTKLKKLEEKYDR